MPGVSFSLLFFRKPHPGTFGYLCKRNLNLSFALLQLKPGCQNGRSAYQRCHQCHHWFRDLRPISSNRDMILEGTVTPKKISEYKEHLPALIRCATIGCVLSTTDWIILSSCISGLACELTVFVVPKWKASWFKSLPATTAFSASDPDSP